MSRSDSCVSLDSEFDQFLLDLKPLVLRLAHKAERQLCALWIRKLCDPGASGPGIMCRKNRNLYARLLLLMLRKGILEDPFTHRPEEGSLKTLPTYMSIYFDEPLGQSFTPSESQEPRSSVLNWASAELRDSMWSSTPVSLTHGKKKLFSSSSPIKPLSSSPVITDVQEDPNVLELKTKVLEAKHQEETLRMQQKHDAEIQKILKRKNCEIDDVKNLYRLKQKEAEETIRCLEQRVQSLLRESQLIQQTKEKQISELKKNSDQSVESLKNDWEKKLHVEVTQMEQEKSDLQRQHTENIKKLLQDTNLRLAEMESTYSQQMKSTEQTVADLEWRLKQLSLEVENGNLLKEKIMKEKAQLEIQAAGISAELQEAMHRNVLLQKEMEETKDQHEKTLQRLQTRHNADIRHFQQEHSLSAAKTSEVIEDLEQMVNHLKQELQEAENTRQRLLQEQESNLKQEKTEVHNSFAKQLEMLQARLEKERGDSKKKISKMDDLLRDKDRQLAALRDDQRLQAQQAESALGNLKKQLEISAHNTFSDMKKKMEEVEADLSSSKSLREKQCKEFNQQLEELQRTYEEQIAELKLQQEQERTQFLQTLVGEKEKLVQEHRREIQALEQQAWVDRNHNAQTVSDLEAQVGSLRKDLAAAHSQKKLQLKEHERLRDQERHQAVLDQEMALQSLRKEMEQLRQDLEKTHRAERELAQQKAKLLEKEHSQKMAKSAQVTAQLQMSLEDTRNAQKTLEQLLEEAQNHWLEEKKRILLQHHQENKVLRERVEAHQRQQHSLEKKLMNQELEKQEQITRIRQECELKIQGLMPAELQQELEDTITSLKAQVTFLQKRASLLQEQLDTPRHRR